MFTCSFAEENANLYYNTALYSINAVLTESASLIMATNVLL